MRAPSTAMENQPVEIVTQRENETAANDDAPEFRLTESGPLSSPRRYARYVVPGLSALLVIGVAAVGLPGAGTADGSLRIESDPRGAEVRINGEHRGGTPLILPLAPGDYTVVIGRGDQAHERKVTIWAGERASIYHVAPSPDVAVATGASAALRTGAATGGTLSVVTEPVGGIVNVDGVERGHAPLVLRDLTPGEHQVDVRNRGAVSRHRVIVAAGATSTVVVGAAAANSAAAGWLRTPQVSVSLQIREGGRLLGTTESETLMLPVGDHQLMFSDQASGFSATRMVRIMAGDTTSVTLEVPQTAVHVNASPWAEVWIDGQLVGETPIGNHVLAIGTHQVELRHPELGTKRVTLAVSLKGPNRLAVNMRER